MSPIVQLKQFTKSSDIKKDHDTMINPREILKKIGVIRNNDTINYNKLPFIPYDVTIGAENEYQTAVCGKIEQVDLPKTILSSNYYLNILKRIQSGEIEKTRINELKNYLTKDKKEIWENSWVRFSPRHLNQFARRIFMRDILADKKHHKKGFRSDLMKFIVIDGGEEKIRIPVSYLLKLSLADIIGEQKELPLFLKKTAFHLLKHYINDNTSPETFSFYLTILAPEYENGLQPAKETSLRFLFSTFLIEYANKKFNLEDINQKVLLYFLPHPPIDQQYLNNIIPDSFYRELFMNPCLSGWDKGEEKYRYMVLCHQVLSRSHLNTLMKLKESGLINNDLVVLPNTSNISLANNGTHISIGSKYLTQLLSNNFGISHIHEKYLGDLVIKIVEHFLPLFVGTYSADPYRMSFMDFHPEKALGFLPHELHYTHLRMLWRRWKKKAHIKVFGRPITPFGPQWLDGFLEKFANLRGDILNDFRLNNYLIALLSTENNSALSGRVGNVEHLKSDLCEMGVFDERMSVYMLYRLREYNQMGYSGFEGRYYSLFENLKYDMANAVTLQALITNLAYKYIAEGTITHEMIPDTPFIESERRQIFFGSAIGIPTFFIKADTRNLFMRRILMMTKRTRHSNRYPGYIRVYSIEYKKALLNILYHDARELIEMWNCKNVLDDLDMRINEPDKYSATGKLLSGILGRSKQKNALKIDSLEFNKKTEEFYRTDLRKKYIEEALMFMQDEILMLERKYSELPYGILQSILYVTEQVSLRNKFEKIRMKFMHAELNKDEIMTLINILTIIIAYRKHIFKNNNLQNNYNEEEDEYSSIYRTINW